MRYPLVLGCSIALAVVSSALVRAGDRPDSMDVAANRSDYIAKSGATVPKPEKIDVDESSQIQRRTPEQIRDDAITRGICVGCTR